MLDRPRIADTSATVTFTLNGKPVQVTADPFASLAVTLREKFGMTGTKIGCEAGDCGACTVLMDGEQVCACLVATAQADGASIETVEGHGPDGLTDRLREAFLAHGAAQCGICTPGMLMAATDCLTHDPHADRPAIEDALGGVLCRCTGYVKIVEAVLDVAGVGTSEPSPRGRGWSRSDGVRGCDVGEFASHAATPHPSPSATPSPSGEGGARSQPSARACNASMGERRSTAPTSSARTPRRQTPCGCVSRARLTPARPSHSAISMR